MSASPKLFYVSNYYRVALQQSAHGLIAINMLPAILSGAIDIMDAIIHNHSIHPCIIFIIDNHIVAGFKITEEVFFDFFSDDRPSWAFQLA